MKSVSGKLIDIEARKRTFFVLPKGRKSVKALKSHFWRPERGFPSFFLSAIDVRLSREVI